MTATIEFFVTASTVVAVAAIAVSYLKFKAQSHRRRVSELFAVKLALESHYKAVEKLTNDPAVSDDLKLTLLTFAEGVSNRDVARLIAREFANGTLLKISRRENAAALREEMLLLRKSRADLTDSFETAVKSGLLALFLRWPETAKIFNRIAAETVDASREAAVFEHTSKAAGRLSKHAQRDDDFPTNGLIPAAC